MREIKNLPAQFLERMGAYCVDIGIVFFVLLVAIFENWGLSKGILITLCVFTFCSVLPNIVFKGQSIGKRTSRIRVVSEDYQSISFLRYAARMYFIVILSIGTFLVYPLLCIILMERRIDKRSLHDFLFKTRVVLVDSKLN